MATMIRGFLYGLICGDIGIFDPIPDAVVFAVPAAADRVALRHGFDQPQTVSLKPVVRKVGAAELEKIQANTSVFKGRTDEKGAFSLEGERYEGQPVDVYAIIEAVPAPAAKDGVVKAHSTVTLYLGTYQPARGREEGWFIVAYIPASVWCAIKAVADAWTIVGRLETCEQHIPISSAVVTAFDTDIVQDDSLGQATTDANGVFRIDYMGAKFRAGTIIDVELFGGPDVYFVVQDNVGNVLLQEDRSVGRTKGRADSPACLCVHLCAKVDRPPINPTAWTMVGKKFLLPDAFSLNDFDTLGFGGPGRYAFTSAIRLAGSAPNVSSANRPIEYRFLVSDAPTANGPAALPPPLGTFTRVIGVGPNAGLFVETEVGQMIRYSPLRVVGVNAKLDDLDADGWLDVNKAIQRTFSTTPGVTPADVPSFNWLDTDGLMALNTGALTNLGVDKVAIRFEIREVVDKPNGVFSALPGSGTTLNSITLNNMAIVSSLSVGSAGAACDAVHTPPSVSYSAAHPYLQSVSINVRSADFAYNTNLTDAPANLPLSSNTNDALTSVGPGTIPVPTSYTSGMVVVTLKKCTYLVTMSAVPRLTDGDIFVGNEPPPQALFYYEP